MRLFLYGTLLDPNLLAALAGHSVPLTPATLRGWRRVALFGNHYPTVRRARGIVEGGLATVKRPALARLTAYERPRYHLMHVVVRTAKGNIAARTWIAPGGMLQDWPLKAPRTNKPPLQR